MSILIKDLELPADGNTLLCIISSDGSVNYKHHKEKKWKLGKAISVTPHGRLIDADALIKEMDEDVLHGADTRKDGEA